LKPNPGIALRIIIDYASGAMDKRTKIRLGLLFLLGYGALVFLHPLSAFWWHLRHGNFIKYANSSIFVPPGWAATTTPRMVVVSKRSATIFSKPDILAMVALSPIPNPPTTESSKEDLYKSFPSVYWASDMVKDRSTIKGPIRLGPVENDATCMQSTSIDKPNLTELFCIIYRGGWKATFEGRPQELDEFYRIILSPPGE
jgi:hypothetical protein